MVTFHEVRLDKHYSFGAKGGPNFNTTIFELSSGVEKRNVNWQDVRAQYDITYNIKTRAELDAIKAFFYARQGRAYGFRFKDFSDYKLERQTIGTTDTTTATFQIYKRYSSGAYYYDRNITKIVADVDVDAYTFTAWVNGVSQTVVEGSSPGASEVAIDRNTGIVTLGSTHAATTGYLVEIQCEFDVPVRFNADTFSSTVVDVEWFDIEPVILVEVRDID